MFKHIRTRLITWLLLIALIPLSIAMFVTYTQRVTSIEAHALEKLVAIRDLKVRQLRDWLEERNGDLNVISVDAKLASLKDINSNDNPGPDSLKQREIIRKYLSHILKYYNAYSEIFIINPLTGRVLVSTNQNSEGKDHSNNEYFTEPMQSGKLFIKDIYYSKTVSNHTMAFAIPVFSHGDDEKLITGILVAYIDLDYSLFSLLQEKTGLGETGETLIVNRDIIALSELRWQADAPLRLKIKAQPAVYAAQGKTGTILTTDYRGKEVLAAYTYIPETGWGFVSKQDTDELYKPVHVMINQFLILFIIAASLISLVALFISKSISTPATELNALAKKIANGDYSVRSVIRSRDELASLAKSINLMAENIQSWHKTLKNKVKSRTEELEVKNAELERFVYAVSHDLKSPLVTIKGFIGMLEEDIGKGDKKHVASDISHINKAALIMVTLLDELLEFSRVGHLDNPYEEISMNDLVDEVIGTLSGSIPKNMKFNIQPELPMAFADRPRIRAVVQNLIENAVKFMGDQPEPCIEIAANTKEGEAVYTVGDNGIGIAPQFHKKVFGMFECLDAAAGGTGMGLALVNRIVEAHGGRVWLESDGEGCGTTLFFALPEQEGIS